MRSLVLIFVMTSLAACSHQQATSASTQSVTVLKGARIIDGTGSAPLEFGAIVISGDRIESVQGPDQQLPPGAKIIDLDGKTIMPALIASHTHLGLTAGTEAGNKNLTPENDLRQLHKYMVYGVGTVLSLGTDYDFIYDLRAKRINRQIETPFILTAGHGFGAPDSAPPIAMGANKVYRPVTSEEVIKDMNELAAHKPDIVKVWVDDFNHTMPKKMKPSLYKEVIVEAHKRGLKVAAHVYYLEDAKRLAEDGVDIFGHSVRDKVVDKEFIALVKKHGIAFIPTLALDDAAFVYADKPSWMNKAFFKDALDAGMWDWLHTKYKPKDQSRKDLEIAKKNVLELSRAGVPLALGTDSGANLTRIQGFAEHRELELLVSAGLTPMQALQIATTGAADVLGLKDRGTLAAGKKADLLILDANPLDDIRNTRKIRAVWLEGTEVARNGNAEIPPAKGH